MDGCQGILSPAADSKIQREYLPFAFQIPRPSRISQGYVLTRKKTELVKPFYLLISSCNIAVKSLEIELYFNF